LMNKVAESNKDSVDACELFQHRLDSVTVNHQPTLAETRAAQNINSSCCTDPYGDDTSDGESDLSSASCSLDEDNMFEANPSAPFRVGSPEEREEDEEMQCARETRARSVSSTNSAVTSRSSGSYWAALPLSALQLCAYQGSGVASKLLLTMHKADPRQRVTARGYEFYGMTASEIALQRGHFAVAHLIQSFMRRPAGESESQSDSDDDGDDDDEQALREEQREGVSIVRPETFKDRATLGVGSADGYKKPTEDRVVVCPMGVGNMTLFCIFDGHNGHHIAETAAANLPVRVRLALTELHARLPADKISPAVLAEVLERCIMGLDQELILQASRNFILRAGGSTAVVALDTPTHVVCASLGDSPAAIFDAVTGRLLAVTRDHTPQDPDELQRVLQRGGATMPNPEYGDVRMRSPSGRSTVSVTRALGQYEFKAGLHPSQYTVTSKPECYCWNKAELKMRCDDPQASRLFLSLYSDSFTEAVVDSNLPPPANAAPNDRPRQIIANTVPHEAVVGHMALCLRNENYHASRTARYLAEKQVAKFLINDYYCGDNTSLLLVSLDQDQAQAQIKVQAQVEVEVEGGQEQQEEGGEGEAVTKRPRARSNPHPAPPVFSL